jgi:membrane protease YdiL (CAAX protease family)
LAVFLVSSMVMAIIAITVVHGTVTREWLTNPDFIADVYRSRVGLLILVVTPQLVLVIPSIVAAILSPEPTRKRLGLVRGHWPIWAWLAAAVATPLVGLVSGLVVGVFMDESETLRQMSDIFRDHGQAGFLLPLSLMIGATPAFCEELLFRGYVQTRLVRSFGPAAGIIVASLAFAAFHMDFVHVVAVFPLGLFLGVIAWRSGSIFPAMLGHFINNVISVVAVVMAPEGQTDVLSMPAAAVSLLVIGLGVLGMVAVAVASVMYGRPQSVAQTV